MIDSWIDNVFYEAVATYAVIVIVAVVIVIGVIVVGFFSDNETKGK